MIYSENVTAGDLITLVNWFQIKYKKRELNRVSKRHLMIRFVMPSCGSRMFAKFILILSCLSVALVPHLMNK